MTAFAFIGVAVTGATIVIFGEAIWDPVVLIARIGSAPVIIAGALVVLAAQLTTNMAANVVSPANDFSSLAPRRVSYVMGGLITAVLGIVMMPWKLYADAAAYIFTWLIGYSSLMGAIGGILIADYWVLRRRELSVPDLFAVDGRYTYQGGVNWRAIAALVLAVLPVLPGFVRAATTPGGQVADPTLARHALHLRVVCDLRAERCDLPGVDAGRSCSAGLQPCQAGAGLKACATFGRYHRFFPCLVFVKSARPSVTRTASRAPRTMTWPLRSSIGSPGRRWPAGRGYSR